MLTHGAGVAVCPPAIIAIILILATPRARLNGLLFTLGWVAGLAALGAIMLAIGGTGGAFTHHHPATWVGALRLALGVPLVLFGAREWRRRPKDPAQAQLPRWMAAIGHLAPPKILGLGLALAAASLKNAPLTMGERAKRMLGSWRDWAAQHNVAMMAVLFFVLGLKLLGDGISTLTS